MARARLHVICGNCGCNDEFTFSIDLEGNCDYDGNTFPSVALTCRNCATIHFLGPDMLPHPIPEKNRHYGPKN